MRLIRIPLFQWKKSLLSLTFVHRHPISMRQITSTETQKLRLHHHAFIINKVVQKQQ